MRKLLAAISFAFMRVALRGWLGRAVRREATLQLVGMILEAHGEEEGRRIIARRFGAFEAITLIAQAKNAGLINL